MAYSSASLTAAELADFAADHPVLGAQVIPTAPTTVKWLSSGTGTTVNTDRTLSTSPARRAYDGYSHLVTQPDTTASNSWTYAMDVGSGIEFDFVAILGHNFNTEGYTQIDVEIADDAAMSTNLITIPIISNPSDDNRIVQWELYHTGSTALRYSNVQYWRITMDKGSDTDPEIGEIILGSRCQMPNAPKFGYGPDDMVSEWSVTRTKSGVSNYILYNEHAHSLNANWLLYDSTVIANVKSWHKATGGLFVYCPQPNTAPNTWYHMALSDYELSYPIVGYNQREFTVSGIEQGPESDYFEQES